MTFTQDYWTIATSTRRWFKSQDSGALGTAVYAGSGFNAIRIADSMDPKIAQAISALPELIHIAKMTEAFQKDREGKPLTKGQSSCLAELASVALAKADDSA